MKKKIDTVYYEEYKKQRNANQGSLSDEYAIYDPRNILPRFVVEYEISNANGENYHLDYFQN